MSNLLQALLSQEAAQRTVTQAVQADEQAEYRRIIEALHEAYAPYEGQVQALKLVGDYGKPVVFGERAPHLCNVKRSTGLGFHLGQRISAQDLQLVVTQRKGAVAASIELRIERHHPYKSESLATFDAKTAPEHLLKTCFEALMQHLHQSSFVDASAVAA